MARKGERPRLEGFPDAAVEIGSYMGDYDAPPRRRALMICQTDSRDQGVLDVTETFLLDIRGSGSGPWTYLLFGRSEFDKGRLLARVTWDKLDPLGGGLRLWTQWLKKRDPRIIRPTAVHPGPCFEKGEVEAAFAEVEAEWDWIFNPRKYPDRYLPMAALWLPWLDEASRLEGLAIYDLPREETQIPEDAKKIAAVFAPNRKDLARFYYVRDGRRLVIHREYLYRQARGSMGLMIPYKKEYATLGEISLRPRAGIRRAALLAFLRLRGEGHVGMIENPGDLSANALNWILEDKEMMERCRRLMEVSQPRS